MDWFYYMIILIKWCKIPYKNLDKALLFSKIQVFYLKNWKLWRAPTIEFNIFCWNFAHVSYLPMSAKGCSGFFKSCLDLELFAKIKKTWFLHTRFLQFQKYSHANWIGTEKWSFTCFESILKMSHSNYV